MAIQKRFVSLLSDFGFKRIFGNRANTNFLKIILQILINSDEPIAEITFDDTVKTPEYDDYRGAVLDFYCVDGKGRNFIIEMQRTRLTTFIHRSKFYTYLHLNEMIEKGGEMRFNKLRPIYAISILDGIAFSNSSEFHQFACLRNQHGELIDNQIMHVLLELGKWNKTQEEIVSNLDILILLMKFTDTATVDTPTPKILTKTEWAAWVLDKLKQDNLTRAERLFYRKEQAKIGYFKGMEEDAAEAKLQLAEAQHKATEAKHKATEAKREATEAKAEAQQKSAEAEQQITEAEQRIISTVLNLLKEGSFTEEKVAEIVNIDIDQVREIKQQLKQ